MQGQRPLPGLLTHIHPEPLSTASTLRSPDPTHLPGAALGQSTSFLNNFALCGSRKQIAHELPISFRSHELSSILALSSPRTPSALTSRSVPRAQTSEITLCPRPPFLRSGRESNKLCCLEVLYPLPELPFSCCSFPSIKHNPRKQLIRLFRATHLGACCPVDLTLPPAPDVKPSQQGKSIYAV